MSKKPSIKHEEFEDLPALFDESYEEDSEALADSILDAAKHQMQIALELTRLVVDKTASNTEKQIFDTYKKSLQIVGESSPLRFILEQFEYPAN